MLVKFGAEIKTFRVFTVLISRHFTRINIRGDKFSLNQNLPFNKTRSPQIDKNDKNIFMTFIYNSAINLPILHDSILQNEIRQEKT